MKINGSLVFDASSASEIQNLRVEKVSANPTWTSADAGRLIYNTTNNIIYIGSDSQWVAMATGGDASALQIEVDAIESSLGLMVDTDGVFDGSVFVGLNSTIWPTPPADLTSAMETLSNYVSGADTLAELGDVDLDNLAFGHLLVYNGAGAWENKSRAAAGIQPSDPTLDALAAFEDAGIMVHTGSDVFAARTIVAPGTGITITDGDGVAGNPTLALADGLASIEALATTGFVVQSSADTFITRDIVTASSGRITVSNGSGVSGSPTVDLATVTDGGTGTFLKVTVDAYGRVSGTTPVIASDVTGLVDSTYVNVAGDTMSGNLNMGGNTVTGLAAPTAGSDAATKNYVDAGIAGLSWKDAARAASSTNVNVASAPSTMDGVTLAADDRVLLMGQTAPAQNGIYVFASAGAALVRATDMDAAAEFSGATLFVQEGGTFANSGWTQTAEITTVGTDAVTFVQFSGSGSYVAGTGLDLTGNTFSVNLGAGIAQLPSDEVGVDLFSTSAGAIILTTNGTARSTASAAQLHLLLPAGSGLTQDATGLYIPAAGVTNAMLVNDSITIDVDGGGSTSVDLGATLAILGDVDQGIETSVVGSDVVVSALDATTSQKGVASFDANHFSVTAGAVSLDASLGDLSNVEASADSPATGDVLTADGDGNWLPASRATIVGSTSVGDHNDVTLTTPGAGDFLINNGSGQFVNRKIYFLYTGASNTSHTVTHNLGQQYCNVTVVDASDEVVIPQSITFDSTTQLTVTFNTAIACKVVVMGV